jgi:hypothetical protein
MYTARIKKWGLKKNYHLEEKDFLVTEITKALANGQSISSITFRGQDIRHRRVLRHWKARKSEEDAVLAGVPPNRPALNGSILPNIEVDDRANESLSPTCDTDAGPTSAIATQSSLVTCCGLQDDASTATISIPFFIAKASPGELIFYATSSYLTSLNETIPSMGSPFVQTSALGSGSNDTLTETASDADDVPETNKFWHDFETAVYLLQIGCFSLGWATFHTTWKMANKAVLSNPTTLLRKLITTLTLGGKLNKFPEILRLVLTFMVDLLQLKFGRYHPLVNICQQLQLDEQSPRTSETTLCLMRDMLERHLGPFHQETFRTQLALIVCRRLNHNLAAAEESARLLIQKSQSSPQGAEQLPQAMRKLAHVLKDLLRYEEAVAICHRILGHHFNTVSYELVIYTREDLAAIHRLQGQLSMESWYLSEALVASQQWFGHTAAPTLHIWDKLKTSLAEQGRVSEAFLWECKMAPCISMGRRS